MNVRVGVPLTLTQISFLWIVVKAAQSVSVLVSYNLHLLKLSCAHRSLKMQMMTLGTRERKVLKPCSYNRCSTVAKTKQTKLITEEQCVHLRNLKQFLLLTVFCSTKSGQISYFPSIHFPGSFLYFSLLLVDFPILDNLSLWYLTH